MSGGDAARREGDDDDEHGSKLVVVGKERGPKRPRKERRRGKCPFPSEEEEKEGVGQCTLLRTTENRAD